MCHLQVYIFFCYFYTFLGDIRLKTRLLTSFKLIWREILFEKKICRSHAVSDPYYWIKMCTVVFLFAQKIWKFAFKLREFAYVCIVFWVLRMTNNTYDIEFYWWQWQIIVLIVVCEVEFSLNRRFMVTQTRYYTKNDQIRVKLNNKSVATIS